MMKTLVVKLDSKKVLELELLADKLKLPLETFAQIILSSIELEDVKDLDTTEKVSTGISEDKLNQIKGKILSKYTELYKRLA